MSPLSEDDDPSGGDPGNLARSASPVRTILTGLSWNTSAQLATTALNVAVTPFFLASLGVDRYGVYALVSSFRGLLSNLDGGFGPCASRYFAVYAGAGDRRRTSSLLVTASLLIAAVVGPLAAIVALVAPEIAVVLHANRGLQASATVLLRLFMPLLVLSAVRGIATRIISAEQRWGYLSAANTAGNAVYLAVSVALVAEGQGLVGLFWGSVAQEAVLLVATFAAVRRLVDARDLRPLPRREARDIVRYALRVQAAEVASSFGNEVNALVVGLLFPVRYVTYYSVGNNFATQLVGLPVNALGPITITLARTFGLSRLRGTIDQFSFIQRLWVRATAAWPLIGAIGAYFGITAWLGPNMRLAGVVAAILLVGQAPAILGMVMDVFCKAVNRPGLESRYLTLATVVDMALAVPLAFGIGMLGVPLGMAAGQVVGTLYLLRLAHKDIDPGLRSFFADAPKLAVALGVAVTLPLELLASRVAPRGAAGLFLCAVPALAGLGVYALTLNGPSRAGGTLRDARDALRARSVPVPGRAALGRAVPAAVLAPPLATSGSDLSGGAPFDRPGEGAFLAGGTDMRAAPPPAATASTPAVASLLQPLEAGGPAGDDNGPSLVAQLRRTRARLRARQCAGVLVLLQVASCAQDPQQPDETLLEDAARALADAVREDDQIILIGASTVAVVLELQADRRHGGATWPSVDLAAIERRLTEAVATGAALHGDQALQSVAVLLEPRHSPVQRP